MIYNYNFFFKGLCWEGTSLQPVNYQEWNHCNDVSHIVFSLFFSFCDVASLNLGVTKKKTNCWVYGDGLISLNIFYSWVNEIKTVVTSVFN